MEQPDIFDDYITQWSTLNFCALLPGLITSMVGIVTAEILGPLDSYLIYGILLLLGQLLFVTSFYVKNYMDLEFLKQAAPRLQEVHGISR